jgi:hypothetical protein
MIIPYEKFEIGTKSSIRSMPSFKKFVGEHNPTMEFPNLASPFTKSSNDIIMDGVEETLKQFEHQKQVASTQGSISEMKQEIDILKSEVKQWKGMSNELYQFCFENLLNKPK